MISRLNAKGFNLELKYLFQNPVLVEAAMHVRVAGMSASQEPVEGETH